MNQLSTKTQADDKRLTFSKPRVEALSDGIFAIILTLLVLEIKVPHLADPSSANELLTALALLSPKIASWVISFFTVCVIWVNHHRLFKLFKGIDHGLFWWNATLLLFVSFIPFPTALMGDYLYNPVAVSLYGIALGLMALSFFFLRWHVIRRPFLLHDEVEFPKFKKATKYSLLFGPVLYIVGAMLGWFYPFVAMWIYASIAIYFIYPHAAQE